MGSWFSSQWEGFKSPGAKATGDTTCNLIRHLAPSNIHVVRSKFLHVTGDEGGRAPQRACSAPSERALIKGTRVLLTLYVLTLMPLALHRHVRERLLIVVYHSIRNADIVRVDLKTNSTDVFAELLVVQ